MATPSGKTSLQKLGKTLLQLLDKESDPLQQLDISHLDEVLQILRECNFSPPKWCVLGVDLGLLKPTLDTIQAQHGIDIHRCLLECISQWLKKADKVIKKGEPTWDSLASALRNIGEVAAAEKILEIEKELSVPACRVCNESLQQITLSKDLIQRLYTNRFISKKTSQEMKKSEGSPLSGSQLKSLQSTLGKDPNKWRVFATVLIQSEEAQCIGRNKLRSVRRNRHHHPMMTRSRGGAVVKPPDRLTL